MRLARGAAGALIALAVLTGCSSKAPANDTLPSAAPTSADASETLPPLGPPDFPMPAEARAQTPAGAEAFLRYYIGLYNAAQESMDTRYLKQFGRACDTCIGLSNQLEEDAKAGYRYQGGDVIVNGISPPLTRRSEAEIAFSITQAALTLTTASGEPVEDLSFPEKKNPACGAILSWSPTTSSWAMTQWDVG
ncbi:DUF6318 family protein [Modestobacter lapidis]|nr:hypothetical protein [Modestobacter lapidis]